jgi:hypothetical protein
MELSRSECVSCVLYVRCVISHWKTADRQLCIGKNGTEVISFRFFFFSSCTFL